jgi:O-Antigen ligase
MADSIDTAHITDAAISGGPARRGFPLLSPHQLALLCVLGAAGVMFALAAASVQPLLALIPGAIIGAALLWWAVRYSTAHPLWLVCPLILIELITSSWILSGAVRAIFHYGLTALFCLPMLPGAWRNRTFARAGFGLYLCYFLWAAVTVSYSLAPAFSAGRLLCALIVFGAISFVIWQVNEPGQVPAALTPLLIGCAVVMAVLALSAVAMPSSLTWIVPTEEDSLSAGDVVRFCGIFNGPNDVGELMLITVGCAAVVWSHVARRRRWLLAALIAVALGASALADSRTPFVALAIGSAGYVLWKYRGRAAVALLVLALAAGAAHFSLDSEGYLARGNVSTLTGRTDVWNFSISQIEERPVLGYGYGASGAILQSRYFPVWWGPWDEGPHSSLHDGYIDRAVGVGVPALLLWLFIILRSWFDVLRRPDDPWGLKPVFFLMVIPMLIHNLAEASIPDCTGLVGISFFLVWAIAERVRILRRESDQDERRERHAALPPAAAALTGSVLAALFLIAAPAAARAQSTYHFPTLPPHAALPSAATCAAAASNGNPWEPRPANFTANHRVPTYVELVGFHLAPIKGSFTRIADFVRVDGNFTGTTDQILRWGACKWGIDEDVVRAEAVVESHWRQDDVGDVSHDISICPPGTGFPGAWDGSSCQQSYGIMQVKFRDYGGWPLPKDSTAFNVDFRLAYQRSCMNGHIHYLADQAPAGDYPRYPQGSIDQITWGCMGDWYSGSWYDAGAIGYIAEMKQTLADRTWTRPGF